MKKETMEKVNTKQENGIEVRLKRKEFNYLDSAMACIAFIVFQFIMTVVIDILPASFRQNFIVAFLLSFLVEAVFFFAVLIVASKRKVEFVEATTINKKPDILSILLAVAISFICLFSFTGLTNVFVNFLYKLGYSSSASLTVPNLFIYFAYLFLICIVPAFCEDLLFRGCILSGLRKLGDHKAVLISAVIFMLMHGGPDQTIHQLIIGVVLGYSFIASGTIWVPIVIHFVNNFVALTGAYLTRNAEVVEAVIPTWGQLFLQFAFAIITAIIGVYLVYFCLNVLKKNRQNKESLKTEKIEGSKTEEIKETQSKEEETKENLTLTENSNKANEEERVNKRTKVFFIISGVYLILNWILALIAGFLL